jgi:hypothetical protein
VPRRAKRDPQKRHAKPRGFPVIVFVLGVVDVNCVYIPTPTCRYVVRAYYFFMRHRSDPHKDPPRRKRRDEPGPVPTLEDLRQAHCWWWVYCSQIDCSHSAPMAMVPLIIRWGRDESSNRLRGCARCTRCFGKGATLSHPSYVDSIVGFQAFPLKQVSAIQVPDNG